MQRVFSFKKLSQASGVVHLITTKDINYPYNFSLALHTGEREGDILKNRRELERLLPDKQFVVANQTHSDNIEIISTPNGHGWSEIESAILDCDSLITNQRDIMLTILTADCVPILLFDPTKRVVSATHAGWRGTKNQIVLKTVEKMVEEFNSNPADILAGVAPSIGRCCYEVDFNVAQHFLEYENSFDEVQGKYLLDLPHINKLQLLSAGLVEESIELSNICTSCSVDNYFSYRKEGGCSGRFMSMIGLE